MAQFWSIIVPEETTNKCQNPSFEVNITDDWTSQDLGSGAVFARSTTRAKFGIASVQITAGTATAHVYQDAFSLADGETLYASVYAYTDTVGASRLRLRDTTNGQNRADTAGTLADQWERLEASWTNSTGGAVDVRLQLQNIEADSSTDVWLDAAQAEIDTSSYTTYCDGDQPGCEWNGAEHASTSTRSAQSRAGGRVYDLADDYEFKSTGQSGAGMAPVDVQIQEWALLPGGECSGVKIKPRQFTITGDIVGSTRADLHDKRKDLLNLFGPAYKPGNQPCRLRYTGGNSDLEIDAYYMSGLEFSPGVQDGFIETNVQIRFIAADPLWYEVGESAVVLDTNDTVTMRYAAGRLKSTGQWDDLGQTSDPASGDGVEAILVASDGNVYYAGSFTDWDGESGDDYIVMYTPSTDTWSTVGSSSDFGALIRCLAEGPDGKIYAGGSFTNAHAVAAADYIAVWNGSAWAAVGTPNTGAASITSIYAMCFDSDGNLYVGGEFTNLGDVAAADYLAKWDGSSWSAVDTPNTGAASITRVQALAVDSEDNLYIGGNFTNLGDVAAADYIGYYDGSAYQAMAALNGVVTSIGVTEDDLVYIGGAFTDASSDSNADRFCMWNGAEFVACGTGVGGNGVLDIVIGPDGMVWLSGQFTSAGGLDRAYMLARWNGASFAHYDLDISDLASPSQCVLAVGRADPVNDRIYDLWIAADDSDSVQIAGTATATNSGTANAYPRIAIKRSGGTSAKVYTIRNETTGKELFINYDLLDGETLTIYLEPTDKRIESDMFGSRPDAVLVGSDFGEFCLQPGSNQITAFVNEAGSPTVTAYMVWKDTYLSLDS